MPSPPAKNLSTKSRETAAADNGAKTLSSEIYASEGTSVDERERPNGTRWPSGARSRAVCGNVGSLLFVTVCTFISLSSRATKSLRKKVKRDCIVDRRPYLRAGLTFRGPRCGTNGAGRKSTGDAAARLFPGRAQRIFFYYYSGCLGRMGSVASALRLLAGVGRDGFLREQLKEENSAAVQMLLLERETRFYNCFGM